MNDKVKNIADYIATFPEAIQNVLIQINKTIADAAPQAVSCMAYGMPAFKYQGKPLVYFGAFAKHIGFYATPSGNDAFATRLSEYKQGKGSVQFPLAEPMPLSLIADMVLYRMQWIDSNATK